LVGLVDRHLDREAVDGACQIVGRGALDREGLDTLRPQTRADETGLRDVGDDTDLPVQGGLLDFTRVLFQFSADVKVGGRSEDTGTVDGMDWAEEPPIGTVDWSPC